jgi:hypothetical protein
LGTAVRGEQSLVPIEQGMGLMLHKCALALITSMLVATPALGIETQPPTTPGPQTADTLRPPAKVPSKTGAKANAATVAKKSNQHAAAQAATEKAKHAKPAKAKSKIAKSKTPNSKLGASNHRNSTAMPANSKHEKSSEAQSRPGTPSDTTGSVPPRSVPSPGLY